MTRRGAGLRVLVVHNAYSSRIPSGENVVVHDEVAWLRDAGVDVELHEVSNDELTTDDAAARARRLVDTTWSRRARRRFADVVDRFAPDLVHVHNLFPLLSASVPAEALRRRLPTVWTAHNRRLLCARGGNFRDDAPCYQCRPGWRAPSVWHACYAESRGATALMGSATAAFLRLVRRRPIVAVAPSDHMRRWLVDTVGIDDDRVRVKRNGVAEPPVDVDPDGAASSRTFVFAGRLEDYKGTHLLLDAWRRIPDADVRLRIVGDGPLAGDVARAAEADTRITWTGYLPAHDIPAQLAMARAVLVPSLWDEPFGLVAVEAMACGRPIVSTRSGALTSLVDDECAWTVDADADALARTLREVAARDDDVIARASGARRRWAAHFSPPATTEALVDVYDHVLHSSGRTPRQVL